MNLRVLHVPRHAFVVLPHVRAMRHATTLSTAYACAILIELVCALALAALVCAWCIVMSLAMAMCVSPGQALAVPGASRRRTCQRWRRWRESVVSIPSVPAEHAQPHRRPGARPQVQDNVTAPPTYMKSFKRLPNASTRRAAAAKCP